MTTRHEFTPDEIEAGIVRAIHDRELEIVPSLIKLLALQDPARAQAVLDTVKLARKLAADQTDVPA